MCLALHKTLFSLVSKYIHSYPVRILHYIYTNSNNIKSIKAFTRVSLWCLSKVLKIRNNIHPKAYFRNNQVLLPIQKVSKGSDSQEICCSLLWSEANLTFLLFTPLQIIHEIIISVITQLSSRPIWLQIHCTYNKNLLRNYCYSCRVKQSTSVIVLSNSTG